MKRILTFLFLLLFFVVDTVSIRAQAIPDNWSVYQSPRYFSNIQEGTNPEQLSSNEYFELLTASAISGLARQLEVKVVETAHLEKASINGASTINYYSTSSYSTDVKLKLVATKTYYSKNERTWYALAYIDKTTAIQYFKKEIEDQLSAVDRLYKNVDNLIEHGYKEKAKTEVILASSYFPKTEEAFYWLKMCGLTGDDYTALLSLRNNLDNLIQQKLTQLGHSTTLFIKCAADSFGSSYTQLESSIKAKLSSEDRSFVESKASADWIIEIVASAREFNAVKYGSLSSFFCYVDVTCSIYKTKTGQLIYEDSFSEKGGSTTSYSEAAKDAYMHLSPKLVGIIDEHIE